MMENNYLCDIYRDDFEQYLKQSILFSKKVNAVYPVIDYPREIDRQWLSKRIKTLNKYADFDNLSLTPVEGKSDRHFNYLDNPGLFEIICKELNLSDTEKACFIEYGHQELLYHSFFDTRPTRLFCSYMYECYNIAIEYTDMHRMFCREFSNHQGNVTSNSDFLYCLLSSDKVRPGGTGSSLETSYEIHPEYDAELFLKKYCEQCEKEKRTQNRLMSPINVNEKVVEILLPDYSALEAEDLYEIRVKANSEIEQLSEYIDGISVVAHDEEELDRLVRRKINPAIDELKAKVKGLHWSALQQALSIRDIAAVPLLITLLPDLPGYIPVGLSALLMGIDISIEIKKEHLELEQDPLYFTFKLNKLAKKRIRKRK